MPLDALHSIYRTLLDHYGPQQWWPAETPYEVLVGAILTQNTAWTNVEKAIANLRQADALTPEGILRLAEDKLQLLIRPAGFFRQKAARLQAVSRLLVQDYRGEIAQICAGDLAEARKRLLALHGVGPETADSILLYAASRPTFVVDAYTGRLFTRLGILSGHERYEAIRTLFMQNLPEDVQLYNEYHALIVVHCKDFCRKHNPDCPPCPLNDTCRFAS